MGRQHQGMDRPGVRQVPEGNGEQGNMEKTGCKIICGAPTTLAVKGLVMIMSLFRNFRWKIVIQIAHIYLIMFVVCVRKRALHAERRPTSTIKYQESRLILATPTDTRSTYK